MLSSSRRRFWKQPPVSTTVRASTRRQAARIAWASVACQRAAISGGGVPRRSSRAIARIAGRRSTSNGSPASSASGSGGASPGAAIASSCAAAWPSYEMSSATPSSAATASNHRPAPLARGGRSVASDAAYRDRLWQQWIQPLAEIERDVLDQLMPLLEPVNRTTGTDVLACVDRQIVLARDLGETPRIEVITDGIDVDPTFTDVDLTEAHLTLALHCDASDPHPEQCPQTRSDWEDTLDRLHAPDPRVIDAVVLPDQLTDSDRAEIVTPGFSALTRPQFDELLSEVPT